MFGVPRILLLEEDNNIVKQRAIRRRLRDASNPLELPNTLVNKSAFTYLLNVLKDSMPPKKKSFGVLPVIKLSACLRFFAEGGYQKGVGRDQEIGLAQSTFSEVLSEFLDILQDTICPKWITYPTQNEGRVIAQNFYEKFGIPGVVGCIDGTHVNIVAPKVNNHLFYNRKGNFSLNVALICDSEMKIRYVDATHPGASHDSFIWNISSVRRALEQDYLQRGSRMWLLGDGGYPLQPWLLTPYRNPNPGSSEQKFNDVHNKCRNIIKRTNGVLKNRWRCLLGARELHYDPKKAIKIINVCAALHNICIAYKCEYVVGDVTELEPNHFTDVESEQSADGARYLAVAQRIRTNITNAL